jgi:hypothetical protein
MNYSKAIETLGLTTPKILAENARLAESKLRHMAANAPLRYKVAAKVVIEAAK